MQKNLMRKAVLGIFVFPFYAAFSQSFSTDSLQYNTALKHIRSQYQNSLKENLLLYSGSEYGRTEQNAKGFPFFETDSATKGSVYYNDNFYDDIPLLYDMALDKVVIFDYKKSNLLTLSSEKIKQFNINGHVFIRLETNSSIKNFGFYERLSDGSTIFWAKREKKLTLSTNSDERNSHFTQYNNYFIQKENALFLTNTEHAIIEILKNKKQEIVRFIHLHNLKFRKDFESSARKVIEYYNQLTN
jgi:hypothetical protein